MSAIPPTSASAPRPQGTGWRGGGLTALIAMAARASSQLALLGVTLVATRSLAPADFGLFAIAAALLTLSRTMLYTGPFEYVLKAPEEHGAAVASAGLLANGLVALACTALLGACGLAAPLLFRGEGIGLLLFALAPSNLLAALAGWEEAMVLRGGQVRGYYAITVGTEAAAGLGAAALLLAGWGVWALVAQVYARLAIFVLAYRALLILPGLPRPCLTETARILRWSGSRYGAILVGFLANYSGDLLLGAVFSPAAAGIYRAGNRVVTALADMFVQPASLLVTTRLAADRARGCTGDAGWLRLAALFAALCWPALAGLALASDLIAPVLLGPQWAGAGPVIAIFCVARIAALPIGVGAAVLVIADRQDRVLWIQGAAALATAGATLALARHGPVAAAVATTAVAVCWALALGWAAAGAHPVPSRDRRGLLPFVAWPCGAALAAAALGRVIVHGYRGGPGEGPGLTPPAALGLILALALAGWAAALLARRAALRQALAVLA